MHADIADTERLAIFVYYARLINKDRVHWRALLPSDDDGERSFFRTDSLSAAEIAALGVGEAANNREDSNLQGWGEMQADVIRSNAPLVLKSDEPPERHGVIIAWPAEIQERNKLAMAMASRTGPVLWPQIP
jgi:hypothetical protein